MLSGFRLAEANMCHQRFVGWLCRPELATAWVGPVQGSEVIAVATATLLCEEPSLTGSRGRQECQSAHRMPSSDAAVPMVPNISSEGPTARVPNQSAPWSSFPSARLLSILPLWFTFFWVFSVCYFALFLVLSVFFLCSFFSFVCLSFALVPPLSLPPPPLPSQCVCLHFHVMFPHIFHSSRTKSCGIRYICLSVCAATHTPTLNGKFPHPTPPFPLPPVIPCSSPPLVWHPSLCHAGRELKIRHAADCLAASSPPLPFLPRWIVYNSCTAGLYLFFETTSHPEPPARPPAWCYVSSSWVVVEATKVWLWWMRACRTERALTAWSLWKESLGFYSDEWLLRAGSISRNFRNVLENNESRAFYSLSVFRRNFKAKARHVCARRTVPEVSTMWKNDTELWEGLS